MTYFSFKSKVVVATLLLLNLITINHSSATQLKREVGSLTTTNNSFHLKEKVQQQQIVLIKRDTLNELLSSTDKNQHDQLTNKLENDEVELKEYLSKVNRSIKKLRKELDNRDQLINQLNDKLNNKERLNKQLQIGAAITLAIIVARPATKFLMEAKRKFFK